jgi:hypothetical protein
MRAPGSEPAETRALQERLSAEAEAAIGWVRPALIAGIDVGLEDRGRVTRPRPRC